MNIGKKVSYWIVGGLVLLALGLLYQIQSIPNGNESDDFKLSEPPHFIKMDIPTDNPMKASLVALGKQLFFDPILSKDGSLSCATCHQPHLAFTDGLSTSIGAEGIVNRRSAPTLLNVGYYYRGLMWDGRLERLEDQVINSIKDSFEFGGDWPTVLEKIKEEPDLRDQFIEGFQLSDKEEIRPEHVAKAIAQFERTLISADSKFDRVAMGLDTFTRLEARGKAIFFDEKDSFPDGECAHCHGGALFTDLEFFNNGLDHAVSLGDLKDLGIGGVNSRYYDRGKFKTPTLRNIALTAPYMHDGRFKNLMEVLDHYNKGGKYSENASPNVRPLNLSDEDKKALIAFLHTLTDERFLRRPGKAPVFY